MISEDKIAVLTDFGFLISSEKPVQQCGAPLEYHCHEGRMTEQGFPEVNGKKFDIWSMGTLAFEIFTKMTLLMEASKLKGWHEQVFPIIQKNL